MIRAGLAFSLTVFLAACTSESGILVAVAGVDVESLEFQVGVLRGEDYFLDPEISGQRFDVRGRNLNASPYELFLREQSEAGDPATLRILSLGRRGDEIYAFDFTEPPQIFIRDEILRRSLVLHRPAHNSTAQPYGSSCWRIRQGDDTWQIHTETDMDCDGSTTDDDPLDCRDDDEAIYPGASEVCDGKENNCDGQIAPESQVCYARFKEVCRAGTRICRDGEGQGGLDPTCTVEATSKQAPEAYCAAYAKCTGPAPLTCMEDGVRRVTRTCDIKTFGGELCDNKGTLEPPVSESHHKGQCRWRLFEMSGITVSFADSTPQNTSISCTPTVFLKSKTDQPETGSVTMEFIYGEGEEEQSVLVTVEVELTSVESKEDCSEPFTCS